MVTTERVEKTLREANQPTNQVANELGVDWHTAKDRLNPLAEKGRHHRSRLPDNTVLWWDREILF